MSHEKPSLHASAAFARVPWVIKLSIVLLTLTLCTSLPANAAGGQFIAHNTPSYVATAKNLGAVDPSTTIDVSMWLNPHNRTAMDALAQQLYDRTSPNYRHWLTRSQIAEQFAPTANEAETVRQFLESHNLTVVQVGPNDFYVRARGSVANVESAFHVELNNYRVGSKIIRANASDPYVEGPAAQFVSAVSGLDSGEYEHPAVQRPTALPSVQSHLAETNLASAASVAPADPGFYSSNCFNGAVKQTFSTNNDGSLPIGTYQGNQLNLPGLTNPGCGYTPQPIQTAYNLTGLYAEGFNGAGQTIVIIDWCGTPTIQNDANAFSAKFGLPPLTPSNFNIIYTPTPSLCEAPLNGEINIDVEWAHAIAPGANIDLVLSPTGYLQDVDQAVFYAVNYGLGNSISGSYGSEEYYTAQTLLETENLISEIAAISGISTNYASGDEGDYAVQPGLPQSVSAPADSPWATAVGGVTLALNPDNTIAWQTGWGNNEILVTDEGVIFNPPLDFGFYAGSGGGMSNCVFQEFEGSPPDVTEVCLGGFPKPNFQKALPGKYRQLPDISWLADPFTGVVIAISVPGQSPELTWVVFGGTSVACPMFSALWAIANQEAREPLGQAAQYMYSMPAGTVTDIVPVSSSTNITASIQTSTGTVDYTPSEVLGGKTNPPWKIISGLWDYPFDFATTLVISFDTDCPMEALTTTEWCYAPSALHTNPGWDNVTGMGTPNGEAFADSFKAAAVAK